MEKQQQQKNKPSWAGKMQQLLQKNNNKKTKTDTIKLKT